MSLALTMKVNCQTTTLTPTLEKATIDRKENWPFEQTILGAETQKVFCYKKISCYKKVAQKWNIEMTIWPWKGFTKDWSLTSTKYEATWCNYCFGFELFKLTIENHLIFGPD